MNATAATTPPSAPASTAHIAPTKIETSRGSIELASWGRGPAVLCLHGAMGGYDQALILARTLGDIGYCYLAPSRPGYLGTPLSRGRSPEEQADLYAALLDALSIEQSAVMAISGGGPSAIHFALRHPSRCSALVLVSTPAGPVNNRLPLSFKVMKLLSRLPWFVSSAKRKVLQDPVRAARRSMTDPDLLAATTQDTETWALFKALLESTVDRMPDRLVGTEVDVAITCTRSYPLGEIAVPTLVVQGTSDPFVSLAQHGKRFEAEIPGAELVALRGGEHTAIFSHRDQARAKVIAFLARHVDRREPAPCAG